MRQLLIVLINLYKRFLSPLFPPVCRFYPSCSTYAVQSLERYGLLKGLWLTVKRLVRCHPCHPGGYDPVPPVRRSREDAGADHTGGRPTELRN